MLCSVAEELAENFLERIAELSREHRVDEGVDGGVAVAQPEDDGEGQGGDAFLTESSDKVHGEEGEPATDEAANNDAKRLRSLGLHAETPHLRLDITLPEFGGCPTIGASTRASRCHGGCHDRGCYGS